MTKRARDSYHSLIGTTPLVGPGDHHAARDHLSKIQMAIAKGGWSAQELKRLHRLKGRWTKRAQGLDPRYEIAGTRGGRLTLREQAKLNHLKETLCEKQPWQLINVKDAAQGYAEAGHRIFPVSSSGKQPCLPKPEPGDAPLPLANWQNPAKGGFHSAICDPGLIAIWWGVLYPHSGIAYAIPPRRIIFDIDTDQTLPTLQEHHPDLYASLLSEETFTVKSPRGMHIYFDLPEDAPDIGMTHSTALLRVSETHPRRIIDIKVGAKSYVLLPPTVRDDGGQYLFRSGSLDAVAELPENWVAALADWPPGSSAAGYLTAETGRSVSLSPTSFSPDTSGPIGRDSGEKYPKGTARYPILFTEASAMRGRGWDEPEIAAALTVINKRIFADPKDQSLVNALAKDICERYTAGERAEPLVVEKETVAPNPPETEAAEPPKNIITHSTKGVIVVSSPKGPKITVSGTHRHDDKSRALLGNLEVVVPKGPDLTSDGTLTRGTIDAENVTNRRTWAKHCDDRTRNVATPDEEADGKRGGSMYGIDHWYSCFDETARAMLASEAPETDAIDAVDLKAEAPEASEISIGGLPLSASEPMLIYGDGSTGKSVLTVWLMMQAHKKNPAIKPLYVDWEMGPGRFRHIVKRLDPNIPRGSLGYIQCKRSISDEIQRLHKAVARQGWNFAVIDSVMPAAAGRPESAEGVISVMASIREVFGGGFILISHVPKRDRNAVYGNIHWVNQVRRAWQATGMDVDDNTKLITLERQKSNTELGNLRVGFEATFGGRFRIIPAEPAARAQKVDRRKPQNGTLQKLKGVLAAAKKPMPVRDIMLALDMSIMDEAALQGIKTQVNRANRDSIASGRPPQFMLTSERKWIDRTLTFDQAGVPPE